MMTATEIASLRDYVSHDHPVVSLYLDVDGARFPRRGDYEAEFSFLVHEARRRARQELGLGKDQEEALDAELSSLGEYLALEFEREGARGLVVFSCRQEDFWRVFTLKQPVENKLLVDFKPRIAPLVESLSGYEHFCVLLTSKEMARIFHAYDGELAERSDILDQVPKHHNQGGWEQNKLQRWHEKEVRIHLKKTSEVTFDFFRTERFDHFAVGISDELWPELEKVLHPYLKERLAGRFNVDISANINEVQSKLFSIEEEERQREIQALLDSLGPELEAGKNYVGGLDDVLAAINEQRVDLLIAERSFSRTGRKCNACGTVSFGEETCPSCRLDMTPLTDVVEEAKELAVRQDARLITVPPGHPALKLAGGIAARLRY